MREWRVYNSILAVTLIAILLGGTTAAKSRTAGHATDYAQLAKPSQPAEFWSFRLLKDRPIPMVIHQEWYRTPIDRFIVAALESKGMAPSAPIDRRRLIRRLYFDLVGLLPDPDEVESFVNDSNPQSYEKLVDRLLSSPHFGERYGRHWLDVARYADSDGMESDRNRPTAYYYRDFVIRALNEDLPYNKFVRWQIAGDEFEPDNAQAIAATGFLTAGPHAELPPNLLEEERTRERYNELDDVLSTTGQAFLGLTFGCARCHDHKYDPITTREYYRMLAAFNAGGRAEVPLVSEEEVAKHRTSEREWNSKLEEAKRAADREGIRSLEQSKPEPIPTALAMTDFGPKPPENFLLDRGDFRRRKELVELGFVSALTRGRPASAYWSEAKAHGTRTNTTYQRRALADWITDPIDGAGALLARVIVNRLWQSHFGEGLVRSVNDFGKRGDAPSHPELLEWLASELVHNGWKLKPIHKMIVMSSTYCQSDHLNPRCARVDPENRLLWRRRPRRMELEIFRDSMLAAAGTLNPQQYGPAFMPPIQTEAIQARNVKDPYPTNVRDTPETRRRTIYMFHKRVVQYPLMQAFDAPDGAASCGRRNVTTVAPQALAILNEPFIRMRALEFAHRLTKEIGNDAAAQVKRAYQLAVGRSPTLQESNSSIRFLQRQSAARTSREKGADGNLLALADLCQVIFGLNEFIYVD